MKNFNYLMIMMLSLCFIAIMPHKTYAETALSMSQQINEKLVTINLKNKSLDFILTEITKQTRVGFAYNNDKVNKDAKMSLDVKKVTVKQALDKLFASSDFTYIVKDNIVQISAKEPRKVTVDIKNVYTGKIVNSNNEPLAGAMIILAGTKDGAISDQDGMFSILAQRGSTLDVSFVGFADERYVVATDRKNMLVIKLIEKELAVNDVVVTGFQNIKQHENVGAVTRISADELDINATKSIEQMLEGLVSGMVVSNVSGVVGQTSKVRVRGTSSLLGSQDPIWVVDGVVQEDPLPFETEDYNSIADGTGDSDDVIKDFVGNAISWLNPNDIEDITVLKDAASTVLYGVKAANGVIVIRTKQGKLNSRTKVDYSTSMTYRAPYDYDDLYMMNSYERLDVERELVEKGRATSGVVAAFGYEYLYNQYLNKAIDYDTFQSSVGALETNNTDWLGTLTRGTFSQEHSLSVSGGTTTMSYYTSAYFSQNIGESLNNSSDKYGFNVNITNWVIPNKLSISTKVSGARQATEGVLGSTSYSYAKDISRTVPAYNEDGSLFYYKYGSYMYNLENEIDNRRNFNTVNSFSGSQAINYQINENLNLNSLVSFGYTSTVGEAYSTEYSYYMSGIRGYDYGSYYPGDLEYEQSKVPIGGELTNTQYTNFSWSARVQANYNKVIDKHSFGATLGYQMSSKKYTGNSTKTYGYMPDRGKTFAYVPLQVISMYFDDEYTDNSIYNSMYSTVTDQLTNYLAYYLNASYTYDNKYVFTGSLRNDASNRFGQGKKPFLPVFSTGFRYNLNEEEFMKKISHIVSGASIRASFGYQGNVCENYGPYLIAAYANSNNEANNYGVLPVEIVSLPYEDLTWEKTRSYDLGIDLSFFQNRISLGFDYYDKKTTDAITYAEVAYEWGIGSMPVNDGTITNKGWDMSVRVIPVKTKNFMWSLSFNYAENTNLVESEMEYSDSWTNAASGNLVKDGYPISAVWGFKYEGIDGTTGMPIISYNGEETGDYDVEDVTSWMYYLGKLDPDFSGGFSTSMRYKTLTFSASFSMQFGAMRWLSEYLPTGTISPYTNLRAEAVNRWQEPGDELDPDCMPGLPYKDGWSTQEKTLADGTSENVYTLYNKSDARFVNADYFKCTSMRVSYSLPSSKLEKMFLNNLSFGLSVSNPFKITSSEFKDVDPEVMFGGTPISRTVSLSINVGI